MSARLLTAITVCIDPETEAKKFLKHRNIQDTDAAKNSFYERIKKDHPTAAYVNWYEKNSTIGKHQTPKGNFIERIYIS